MTLRKSAARAFCALLVGFPISAGAELLGTGIVFVGDGASVLCRLTNIGSKPLEVLGVRVLGNAPGSGTLGLDTCSGTLEPDSSCVFNGTAASGHIGGAAEVKGKAGGARGVCVLSGTSAETVYLELR